MDILDLKAEILRRLRDVQNPTKDELQSLAHTLQYKYDYDASQSVDWNYQQFQRLFFVDGKLCQNKNGRPKGKSKKKNKPSARRYVCHGDEALHNALTDYLWLRGCKIRPSWFMRLTEFYVEGKPAPQSMFVTMMKAPGLLCDRAPDGKVNWIWLDDAHSKRTGHYLSGKLLSERALSRHPWCKVKRTPLRKRLQQGMSALKAMTTQATDNAAEWRVFRFNEESTLQNGEGVFEPIEESTLYDEDWTAI